MTYKVGDLVRVIDPGPDADDDLYCWLESMNKAIGKTFRVIKTEGHASKMYYKLTPIDQQGEDPYPYITWAQNWLEPDGSEELEADLAALLNN